MVLPCGRVARCRTFFNLPAFVDLHLLQTLFFWFLRRTTKLRFLRRTTKLRFLRRTTKLRFKLQSLPLLTEAVLTKNHDTPLQTPVATAPYGSGSYNGKRTSLGARTSPSASSQASRLPHGHSRTNTDKHEQAQTNTNKHRLKQVHYVHSPSTFLTVSTPFTLSSPPNPY